MDVRLKEINAKLDRIMQKQDIHDQFTNQSFEELKDVIKEGNLTIIDFIKLNANKNIQLISLFGAITTLFSIVFSVLLHIHLINPFFAILMFVASIGFFLMTKVEKKLKKQRDH